MPCEPRSARTSPGLVAGLLLVVPLCSCERDAATPRGAPGGAAPPTTASDEPAVERPARGDAASAAPLVPQAEQALARRDLARALELAERALALDPAHAEARMVRVRVLLEEGPAMDLDRALVDVRTLRLDAPDDPALLANEGLIRFHLGQQERARPLLERAHSLPFPAGEESVRAAVAESLGWLELEERRADVATRRFEEARQLAPSIASPCLGLAAASEARSDGEAQERWLREAIAREPEQLAARHALHAFLARQRRFEEAAREKELAELLRQLQDDTSLAFVNDHAQKARLWGRVAELLPEDEPAALNCLKELALAGDFEAARRRIDHFAARPGARAETWRTARRELARAERAARETRTATTPAREEDH